MVLWLVKAAVTLAEKTKVSVAGGGEGEERLGRDASYCFPIQQIVEAGSSFRGSGSQK